MIQSEKLARNQANQVCDKFTIATSYSLDSRAPPPSGGSDPDEAELLDMG